VSEFRAVKRRKPRVASRRGVWASGGSAAALRSANRYWKEKRNYAEETVGKCDSLPGRCPSHRSRLPASVGRRLAIDYSARRFPGAGASVYREAPRQTQQPCVGGTIGSRRSRRNNRECICDFAPVLVTNWGRTTMIAARPRPARDTKTKRDVTNSPTRRHRNKKNRRVSPMLTVSQRSVNPTARRERVWPPPRSISAVVFESREARNRRLRRV